MVQRPSIDDIIDRIEENRADNNGLWMSILRIAMEHDPEGTRAIVKEIGYHDLEVNKWLGKL